MAEAGTQDFQHYTWKMTDMFQCVYFCFKLSLVELAEMLHMIF